jgi:cytoskeleton protein RodZ
MTNEENSTNPNDANANVGPGEILSSAREQQGLTQQQVADRLHLRLSSVQAIESDSIEKGVSITFTKGYVRLYARLMGISADPLLKSFDKLHALSNTPSKLQSFSKRVEREANDSRWNFVTYIIILLLVGLLVVWWVDQSNFSFSDALNTDAQNSSSPTSAAPIAVEQSNVEQNTSDRQQGIDTSIVDSDIAEALTSSTDPELAVESAVEDNSLQAETDSNPSNIATETTQADDVTSAGQGVIENDTSTVTQTGELVQGAAQEIESVVDDSDALADTQANTQDDSQTSTTIDQDLPYAVNSDGSVDMVFTFADDCWVSVKDAFDQTIAVGVKVKGRVMEVSGVPPIEIILGAPQVVEIDFGGQAVDMSGFDDGRSANFQLPLQGE